MQQKDQNVAANTDNVTMNPPKPRIKQAVNESSVSGDATPQTGKVGCKVSLLGMPMASRFVADGKENATPSTTNSRKSKEAAAARLHEIAPDIALYEKEKKRVGGVVYGGRRKTDEDLIVPANTKKRRSAEPQEEDEADDKTEAKRQKKSKPPVTIHLLITGYQKWIGNIKKEDADKVGFVLTVYLGYFSNIYHSDSSVTWVSRSSKTPKNALILQLHLYYAHRSLSML
jgi:hypothetical protein